VAGFDGNNQPLIDAVTNVWVAHLDLVPPTITSKRDVVVETKLAPVRVKFAYPTAADAVDGPVPVGCDPPSGSPFAFGTWPIVCTATDSSGNTSHSVFRVVVRLPTTAGAVTPPGNPAKPLTHVDPGQRVRVTAGGFAPGAPVLVSFITAAGVSSDLARTAAGADGRIDVRVKIPGRIPRGTSEVTATSVDADGGEFTRAWVVTVDGGPKPRPGNHP
jgi:hypothetical protein